MQTFSSLFVGGLLGIGLVHVARRQSSDRPNYIFAAGLTVAAAIYAAFSMNAGPAAWVIIEIAGVGLFASLSIAGYRKSVLILAAGWILHVGWDVLHQAVESIRFIPVWYPSLCIAFDIVVGVHLFMTWSKERRSAS